MHQEFDALGIFTVQDFLLKKDNHMDHGYLRRIIRYCPTHWFTRNMDSVVLTTTLYAGVTKQKWPVKEIYRYLRDAKEIRLSAVGAWSKDLEEDIKPQWFQACTKANIIPDIFLKSFHIRFLNRGFLLNNVLSKFANVSPNCTLCGAEPETFIHLFWRCSIIQTY